MNPARTALIVGVMVTGATFSVMAFAFDPERAGSPWMLIAIGALYASLSVATILRLRSRGLLRKDLRPASGDLAVGAFTAGALYGLAQLAHVVFLARGSVREAWLIRVYLQVGDPEQSGRLVVTATVFVIAALEELVWRGLVFRVFERAMSERKALLLSTFLFGLAHLPTTFDLRDPGAGPNPLIPLAAFGCGLVWCALVVRTRRLVPALFAHAFFTWAVVEFPIWRP